MSRGAGEMMRDVRARAAALFDEAGVGSAVVISPKPGRLHFEGVLGDGTERVLWVSPVPEMGGYSWFMGSYDAVDRGRSTEGRRYGDLDFLAVTLRIWFVEGGDFEAVDRVNPEIEGRDG